MEEEELHLEDILAINPPVDVEAMLLLFATLVLPYLVSATDFKTSEMLWRREGERGEEGREGGGREGGREGRVGGNKRTN